MSCSRLLALLLALAAPGVAAAEPGDEVPAAADPRESLARLDATIPENGIGEALRAYLRSGARTAVGDHPSATAGYREALEAALADPDDESRAVALASLLQLRRALADQPRSRVEPAVALVDRVPLPDPSWLPVVIELLELRGDLHYMEADVEAAGRDGAARGCLVDWLGTGPEGPTGLDRWWRDPPEGWRLHPADWSTSPGFAARPERSWTPDVFVCNLTLARKGESRPGVIRISSVVTVPEGVDVSVLRIVTMNPFLVLIDGTEVARVDRFRESAGTVTDLELRAAAGAHRLDVQFASPFARPTVSLAMLGIGPDGRAATFDQSDDLSIETPPAFTGSASVLAQDQAGRGWISLVALDAAHLAGRAEEAARIVESLAESAFAHDNPLVYLRAAEVVLADPTLTVTEGRRRAAAFLDRLGPLRDGLIVPRLLEADWALEDADLDDAIEILKEAAAAFPDDPTVVRKLADVYMDRDWIEEARAAIDTLASLVPDGCTAAQARLSLASSIGRYDEMDAASRALVECLPSSFSRAGALATMERWDEAIAETRRLAPLYADPYQAGIAVARYRLRMGDTDGLEDLLRARLDDFPEDGDALATLADLLMREGRDAEALALWDDALARLGEAQAGDALRMSSALRGLDPYSAMEIDGRVAIAAYEARRGPGEAPSTEVLDHTVSRLFPDGSIRMVTHSVLKLSSQEAIDAYGQTGSGGGGMLLARTIAPDGSMTDAVGIAQGSATSFPNLVPGCYIEMLSTRTSPPVPLLDGGADHWRFYFGSQNELMARSEFILVAPDGYPLEVSPRADPPERIATPLGALAVNRWTALDVPPIHPEPLAVSSDAYVPSVHVSNGFSWPAAVAAVAEDLYAGDYLPTEAADFARTRCAGLNDLDCARSLYSWILDTVESGGFSESLASTYQRKAGSRSRLLYWMLDAVGARAELLLATSIERDATESPIAEPGRFYHPVVAVGGIYLTLEHDEAPFGFLSPETRGTKAIRLYPRTEGVEIVDLPAGDPAADGVTARLDLDVDPATGDITVHGEYTLRGSYASDVRDGLQGRSPADRQNDLSSMYVSPTFPGAQVDEIDVEALEDREAPLVVRFDARGAGLAARRAGGFILPPLLPQRLSGGFAPLPEVEYPAVAFPPLDVDLRATVRAPGASIPPPPGASVDRSGVMFSQSVEPVDGGFVLVRHLSVAMARIEPPDYPAFAQAIRRAESLWNVPLEVRVPR